MSRREHSEPKLTALYKRYLNDVESANFIMSVAERYTLPTLYRLAAGGSRVTRRASVLAIGFLGDFESNAALGDRLQDEDRGVRILAENAIRDLWYRDGHHGQRRAVRIATRLNHASEFEEAIDLVSEVIHEVPHFAEAWNQRAVSWFNLDQFERSLDDCQEVLKYNPYHFAACVGMAHCYLEISEPKHALDCFHQALEIYPDLEGVRGQVRFLEKALRRNP